MQKNHKIILILIIFGGFLCRLYRFNYPLMDWHSFRQADTASVTREFVKHNYPIWLPHYHDLGNIQSGLDNTEGYRMVEFPIMNYLQAQILKIFPTWDLVIFSRLFSAIFSTLSIYLLFLVLQNWQKNSRLSLFAAGFLAFLPYSIFYGRTILPEPFQITFSLATLLCFTLYLQKPQFLLWLGTLLSFTLALLVKPTSIFIAPVLLVLAWQKYGWRCLKRPELYLLAFGSVLPLLWWRQFILQFPSGIPASNWLYNGNGIRLRPAWWRWLFYERLTKMWLGYFGLAFFLPGLLPEKFSFSQPAKIKLTSFDFLSYTYLFSLFLYLAIFATGNVQHDYYQVLLLPGVAIIFARGCVFLSSRLIAFFRQKHLSSFYSRFYFCAFFILFLSFTWLFAWQQNSGKFNVNNWHEVEIGTIADKIIPIDAKVIADGFAGDTNFLFQTNRLGWPDSNNLDHKITLGAQYYITANFNDRFHELAALYPVFYQDKSGAILNLTQPLTQTESSAVTHLESSF